MLVVDDERRYRELLEMNLSRRGYRVRQAVDGLSAVNAVQAEEPALVVLDLKLPDMDGYEVCRRIRAFSRVPIIMLTARAEPAEKIRGLTAGADDYVTKPFSAEELLARVDAVLRRAGSARGASLATTFETGELRIDFAQHRVTVRGGEVELSPGEFRLLAELGGVDPGDQRQSYAGPSPQGGRAAGNTVRPAKLLGIVRSVTRSTEIAWNVSVSATAASILGTGAAIVRWLRVCRRLKSDASSHSWQPRLFL